MPFTFSYVCLFFDDLFFKKKNSIPRITTAGRPIKATAALTFLLLPPLFQILKEKLINLLYAVSG